MNNFDALRKRVEAAGDEPMIYLMWCPDSVEDCYELIRREFGIEEAP